MRNDRQVFDKLCRENTGSHICDSGQVYGYNYERPLSKEDIIINTTESEDGKTILESMYIHLPAFLEFNFVRTKETQRINRIWQKWVDKQDSYDVEGFLDYMHDKGQLTQYKYIGADNTYNNENDLDQDLLYHIIATDDDWYYQDDTIFFISPHCGCDIRGGYPCPLVVMYRGEEAGMFDMTVGLYVTDENNDSIDEFEDLQVGYTRCPQYQIEKHENIKYILVDKDSNMKLVTNDGREFNCCLDARIS